MAIFTCGHVVYQFGDYIYKLDLEASRAWTNQKWYKNGNGNWVTCERIQVNFKQAIVIVAEEILPWWQNHVHTKFSVALRKHWSIVGARVLFVNMRYYDMLIDCALEARRARNLAPLYVIANLHGDSRRVLCEGIIGLASAWSTIHTKLQWWNKCMQAATLGIREIYIYIDPMYYNRLDYGAAMADAIIGTNVYNGMRMEIHPSRHEFARFRKQEAEWTERVALRLTLGKVDRRIKFETNVFRLITRFLV